MNDGLSRARIEAELARREAERELRRHQELLARQPTAKAELREWFEGALGYEFKEGKLVLGDTCYGEDSTVPLDWLWEIYAFACGRSDDGEWRELSPKELSQKPKSYVLHGPRGGMKTLGMAALWFTLCWWIPNYSAVHSASEIPQSQKCVKYIRDNWAASPLFREGVTCNTVRADFANGSVLYLVTASIRGFNAPHTLAFSCDEVDLMDENVLDQGWSIPQRQVGRNLPAVTLLGSTWKQPNRTMANLIAACQRGEHRLFKWNAYDVVERCPDWRTEELPAGLTCRDYSRIAEQMEMLERKRPVELSVEERELLAKLRLQREKLESNCPLVADCRGLAKAGAGHYMIDDIIARMKMDRDTYEAEILCRKPSMRGAVYERYSKDNETKDAIWRPGLKVIGCADYGFSTDPAAAGLLAINGPYYDQFLEIHEHNLYSRDQARLYRRLTDKYNVSYWIVDRTAKELIRYMREQGLQVVASDSNIKNGIEDLAQLVCNGEMFRALRINPEACPETCMELVSYKKSETTGEPKNGQADHHCDRLRYFARHLMRHKRALNTTLKAARRMGSSGTRRPSPGADRSFDAIP